MCKIYRKNNGRLNCSRLVIFILFMGLITVIGCKNGNDPTIELEQFTLANFPTTPPAWNIWVISDTTAGTKDEFDNLRTALLAANGRKIKLMFPNITAIPDNAFSSGTDIESLVSVSAPKCITIGMRSFENCTFLITINFPAATTIGSYAFVGTFALLEVNLPQATTINSQAFLDASALTTINLPRATTIGEAAFTTCPKLTRVLIATDSTLENIGAPVFTPGYVSSIDVYTANVSVFEQYEKDYTVTFKDIIPQ